MKRKPNLRGRPSSITKARAEQINNNCSEEYLDHGQTSFATKAELCETILWLGQHWGDELRRKDKALDAIGMLACRARLYIPDEELIKKGLPSLKSMIDEVYTNPDVDSR